MWSALAERRAALLGMTRSSRARENRRGYRMDKYDTPPPATEGDVLAVERHYGIRLPEDYRRFLIEVANGGYGPTHYPLLPLAEVADRSRGRLDRPFPFDRTWIFHDPDAEPLDDDAVEAARHSLSLAGVMAETDPVEPCLYPVDLDTVDDGALFLGTSGCDLDFHLVLTGPRRGEVWHSRSAGVGRVATSFHAWYAAWLDEAEARVALPERVVWLVEQGRPAEALEHIATALETPARSPSDALALPAAAARRALEGRPGDARALLALHRDTPDWMKRLSTLAAHVESQYADAVDDPLVEYTLDEARASRAAVLASGRLDWHFRHWRSARDDALARLGEDETVLRVAGWFELRLGSPRDALQYLARVTRPSADVWNLEGCAWLDLGEAAHAEVVLSEVVAARPTWHPGRSNLALAWALAGRIDEARAAHGALLAGEGDAWDVVGLAQVEVLAGQLELAADMVRTAVFDMDFDLWRIAIDPAFAPLHTTPKYRALVADYIG